MINLSYQLISIGFSFLYGFLFGFFMTKHNIDNLIGNTPTIKIKAQYKENIVNIYAKLEYYNFTGSIKDRLALYIINDAKKQRNIKRQHANN